MKPLWTTADLIDLHAFLLQDEETQRLQGEAPLIKRDRLMYLTKIDPRLGGGQEMPARLLVRRWLDLRRLQRSGGSRNGGEPLPGELWREMAGLGRWLALLAGLLTGMGLAGSLLLYSGTTPINVSAYFGLFVITQLGLVGTLLLLTLWRRAWRISLDSSILYRSLARLALAAAGSLHRRLHRRMGDTARLDLAALAGAVRQGQERAVLLVWPAFVLAQLAGIGFNLGVLGATLSRVMFSDIAFAWQSTLSLAPETVAELVRWLAAPWSWFADAAYPTLAQVRGSQMILKEGARHLASADLASWWPFLCWSVTVYGLLPRTALAVLGSWRQRRVLDGLHFAGLEYRPLLQRLLTPRIETDGLTRTWRSEPPAETPNEQAPQVGDAVSEPMASSVLAAALGPSTGRWLVLIPDELFDDLPQGELAGLLRPWTLGAPAEAVRFGAPEAAESTWLEPLCQAAAEAALAGVLLLQEAWQPPLREHSRLLTEARRAAGTGTPLLIGLIGKPQGQNLLTPVSADHLHIWQRTIQALGDAQCRAVALVQP